MPTDYAALAKRYGGTPAPAEASREPRPDTAAAPSQPNPLNAIGIDVVTDEQWDQMTPHERLDGILKAAGRGLSSMMGWGEAGHTYFDNPGTTLATAALGAGGAAVAPRLPPGSFDKVKEAGKAVLGAGATTIKYEALKFGLERAGVPSAVAAPLAMVLSGRRAPKRATPQETASAPAPPAAPVEPVASIPVAPTPQAAPTAAPSASARPAIPTRDPRLSPQRIQNELGMAARRQRVKLSEAEYAEAESRVRQGQTPAEAVTTIAQRQTASPAPATSTAAEAPAPKVPELTRSKLTAAESKEYLRLVKAGKKHHEAMAAIQQLRDLAARFGTPSPEEVRRAVAERNATGRWPQGTP